jgi:general secretion pathway protein A
MPTSLSPASAAVLALAVLGGFVLFLFADARHQTANDAVKRAAWVAQLVARDYERFVEDARSPLVELSRRPDVRALDPEACQAVVRRLESVRGFLDAFLSHPTGDAVCAVRQDRVDGPRVRSTPFLRGAAISAPRFGHYAIDPLTRRGIATVTAPAVDEAGSVRAILSVTLDLSALPLDITDAGLPAGAAVLVADSAGLVLAHSPAPASAIGEFLTEAVVKRLGARNAGAMDAVDLAGASAHVIFAPLAGDMARFGDASVIVTVPDASLFGQAAWSTARQFGALALTLLILVGLAWIVLESFVARPAALLAQAMRRLVSAGGRGEPAPPRLVVDGTHGALRDALDAYETIASRVIEREACARLFQPPSLDGEGDRPDSERTAAPSHQAPTQNAPVSHPVLTRAPLARREVIPPRPGARRKSAGAQTRRNPVEAHWGLEEPAFENAPNPRFLYLSPGHEAVLRGLTYAVRQRRGCGVLVGKPGCGKTMLVRSLIQQLEPAWYDVAFLLRPPHDPIGVLREILYELGLQTDEKRRSELLHLLGARFVSNLGRHRETVIVVDEAHLAPARTLKELGLLLNYQSNERSLVTVVLSGSLELGERLTASGHLDGRLGVRCRIPPLDAEHTGKYVTHRLTTAGGAATIFTADALRLIHEMTDGIPRAINDVCDNVLLLGSLNAVSQIDADTLRSMLNPSARVNDHASILDLPATWLPQHRTADDLR